MTNYYCHYTKMKNKIENIMEKLNLDAIILTDYYNKRYFTGFTGSSGTALVTKTKKVFMSDSRYTSQATEQVKSYGFTFIENNTRDLNPLVEIAKELDIKTLGIDNLSLSFSEYENIKTNFEFAKLVKVSNELLNCRKIKTAEEIKNIEMAIKISEEALADTIPHIKEGISEIEIAAILEYNQRKRGASGTSFDTIVASGKRSALPHGVASNKLIEKEEFITIDYGCYYNGYVSDITRTLYFGNNIESRKKEIYETVKNANILGCSLLKPGIEASEVDRLVRESMKDDAKYFGHSLGHSYGLEVHESPLLSQRAKGVILEEGMTLTIEPGIYIENYCGVRIEDDLIVTKDGARRLTKSDRELIIINY